MKHLVTSIADQDFDPFYPDETIYKLSFFLVPELIGKTDRVILLWSEN
jgi:hypothetical protein